MNSAPLLAASDLVKGFPLKRSAFDLLAHRPVRKVQALDRVSLEIAQGETLGIVGESGCGKSTLARCLVRLQEPDAGAVSFNGLDVLALRGSARRAYNRQVQMVFQDPYGSLNPRLTVGEALGEALRVHRIVPPAQISGRVSHLLDLVHLPREAARRYPREFSGGQRQRVGIARALAVEPSIVIADEPVSALDVSVQAQIVNLLLELQQRLGLALIFITQDLRLVRHISHRVAVMSLGRIVETGDTEALFAAPRHPYTRALIAAVPQIAHGDRAAREPLRGELPSAVDPPPGCPFHPRCPVAEARCRVDVPALDLRSCGWPVACHLAGAPAMEGIGQ